MGSGQSQKMYALLIHPVKSPAVRGFFYALKNQIMALEAHTHQDS